MSLVIGTKTFANAATGMHGIAGKYWLSCHYSGAKYGVEKVHAPGQDGHSIKRHGFGGRSIDAEVLIVGADAAACGTELASIETAVLNQAVSIVTPDGITFPSCEVSEIQTLRGPRATGAGTHRLHVRIVAEQERLV